MEAERPLRRFAVVKGGNGARARAGLTLEVTHCGPARVPPCERSHTTVDPACYALIGGSLSLGVTSMGHLGRTQKSQAASEKKLKAYACELEQKLEARTRELSEARGHLSEALKPCWRMRPASARPSSAYCIYPTRTGFALWPCMGQGLNWLRRVGANRCTAPPPGLRSAARWRSNSLFRSPTSRLNRATSMRRQA